jgi:hypothetical protein
MNTRKDWMSDNDIFGNNFSKDYFLGLIKDRFDIQRYESLEGFEVEVINDITNDSGYNQEQVVIQDFTNPLNEYREDRKIFFDTNSIAQRGSFILYKNRYWLILTKVESNEAYLNAKITECENILKWKNESDDLQEQPAYITEKSKTSVGVNDGKHMIIGNTEYIIWLQKNPETEKITRDKRFIFNNLAYKVVYVDHVSRTGVVGLIVEEDQINENYDNKEEGIARDTTVTGEEDSRWGDF